MRRGKKMLCRVIPVLAIAVILMTFVAPIATAYEVDGDKILENNRKLIDVSSKETTLEAILGDIDTITVVVVVAVIAVFLAIALVIREKRKTEKALAAISRSSRGRLEKTKSEKE